MDLGRILAESVVDAAGFRVGDEVFVTRVGGGEKIDAFNVAGAGEEVIGIADKGGIFAQLDFFNLERTGADGVLPEGIGGEVFGCDILQAVHGQNRPL